MTFLKAFPFEDSPFFQHTVGFDRIFDQLETVRHNMDNPGGRAETKYPPYNIVKTGDDTFTIELAVAGFSKENLDVEIKENILSVKDQRKKKPLKGRMYTKALRAVRLKGTSPWRTTSKL